MINAAPILIILVILLPICTVLAYSLGVDHGREKQFKLPKHGGYISNAFRSKDHSAYVPGRDNNRIMEGEEEDNFDY